MNEMWQCLDMVQVFLNGTEFSHAEGLIRPETIVLICEDAIIEVIIEQSNNQPSILIVSDSPSVVALSC